MCEFFPLLLYCPRVFHLLRINLLKLKTFFVFKGARRPRKRSNFHNRQAKLVLLYSVYCKMQILWKYKLKFRQQRWAWPCETTVRSGHFFLFLFILSFFWYSGRITIICDWWHIRTQPTAETNIKYFYTKKSCLTYLTDTSPFHTPLPCEQPLPISASSAAPRSGFGASGENRAPSPILLWKYLPLVPYNS